MPAAPQSNNEQGLRHQLGAGQMAMVAVGGSIGTGLLLGSAAALEIARRAAYGILDGEQTSAAKK